MTLDEIAAALGLNEKTIDRDSKSIAEKFRAAGIELATLTVGEAKLVAAVIVFGLQKKCPDDLDPVSGGEGEQYIPRRWSKT